MKVSIITACYNCEKTISDTVRSVKRQTYRNIEHIIVDGKSSDQTLDRIDDSGFDGILISEKDNGLYEAMNKGIHRASGDIVGLLNADDFFHNNDVIKNIVEAFEEENCDALYGDLVFVHPTKTKQVKRRWIAGGYDQKLFLKGWMPPHPTFYVRKEIYQRFGSFNIQLKNSADYELLVRLLYVNHVKVKYLPGIFVHMRAGGRSTGSIINRIRAHREDYQAWSLNDTRHKWYTIILKPLRKIKQFIITYKNFA